MNCYRAIIVEDEPHTARYIRTIVEDTGLFSVDAAFESAEEALEYEALDEIHLMITDIKMEGETGLELIKRIAAVNPQIISVIISGYSTFSYAQEAIELKVFQYLLKPIKKEELNKTLLNIYDELSHIQEQAGKEFLMKLPEESLSFFKNTTEDPDRFLQSLYVLGSFDVQTMILRCRSMFRKSKTKLFYYLYREGFVILEYSDTAMDKLSGTMQRVCQALLSWEKNADETCLIVYTPESIGEKSFRSEIRRIFRFHQKHMILGKAEAVPYKKENIDSVQISRQDDVELEHIQKALVAGDLILFHTHYGNLFDLWEKRNENMLMMREELFRIVTMMKRSFENGTDALQMMNSILSCVYKASGFLEAKKSTMEIFSREWIDVEKKEMDHQRQSEKLYRQITQYLRENMRENYSLLEIANIFNISQPYVSKLFRTYAGMSYKDYVTNEKIKISIQLMRANPNYLIKDIAERLGYDQIYFSTVFHRITGKYPTKFREKQSEEEVKE